MKMTLHECDLPLRHPFAISRGTTTVQRSLVVELEHEGLSGFGEVTENNYYGYTLESIRSSLVGIEPLLSQYVDAPPGEVWSDAQARLRNMFALSALDMAAHDLFARRQGLPLFESWGLTWQQIPQSSFTIGIAPIPEMIRKLQEEPGWGIYKIKLGTSEDVSIVRALREHTDATFRVDANCAWTTRQALDHVEALSELGVEFIEQPLSPSAPDSDHRELFEKSALPIIADENCLEENDVAKCEGKFHGVNVKLCKCGGLTPALKMLRKARNNSMKTMVGCMIESSVGISAAAHLMPLLDYADLDGSLLISSDPADGVIINQGEVQLSSRHGSGAQMKSSWSNSSNVACV
ncbi:dipeptide epimerase [Bremerella sp. JC770]|uniref:dipeptide epimerase n=1 Tax=Bremerella sp. JC770 TaxID=3232137 RepID=UPI003458C3E3